ncbi:helix-turn-helix domain-containing protein [Algihabitans sp.]|uniref:helix-turn-helix domain-containing protein n=1 Tax=Algihabitans sp. TaxID=2821514 RepID=UPI003BA9D5C4
MATLGQRLRRWRRSLGLSLDAAAQKVEITKGYLSRIENDLASPSIAVLNRISQAYGAPLSQLLDTGGSDKISVVRVADRLAMNRDSGEHGYLYDLVNHKKADRRTECFVVTLPPIDEPPELFSHAGEELFFVLTGRVRFVYGGTELILETGDAIYFDAAIQHRGLAYGGEPATALAVIVPPDTEGD